ncbi:MAG: hypothetical protein LC802_17250 [Acidobacteria bacterium]|nr:hypothetical protein [Acidobacteriota bacterium]
MAEVLVRCDLPGCEVRVDGKLRGLTNDKGEYRLDDIQRGTRKIAISKEGYEGDARSFTLGCGENEPANLSLKIRPVKLRIRTNPPGAEVLVNDPPASVGRSSAEGTLEYTATTPALLVRARKDGYQSDSRRILVSPAEAQREVLLTLKPIPAQLTVGVNIASARVRVDKEGVRPLTSEPLHLAPGAHRVEVDALGYAPTTVELTTGPGEMLKRAVTLERLPLAELVAQAEAAFKQSAYENVLLLSGYAFEADPRVPAAHRLVGLTHIARQEYAKAEQHLTQALAGGEVIALPVRRHSRESFDPVKGHDACEGFLHLGKSEVEYRGRQVTAENFKVPYTQVQIAGLQLKKNVAVYLATKVADARGKKQEFNFFSFDKELSQMGRSYLEMIQRLLRAH